MRLRWLFLLVFLAGLLVSLALGSAAGAQAGGWLVAAAMSAIGLVGTVWAQRTDREEPVAPAAIALKDPARLADAPALPRVEPVPIPSSIAPQPAEATDASFREYFEQAPLPLIVMDREGRIQRMNRAAEQVTEFATAEVRSEPYWNVFLAESEMTATAADYRDVMLSRQAPARREAWKTRTGALAHFDWWRTILKDHHGQASGLLAAAMPVVEATEPVDLPALADQLTAVNGYAEFLLQSMGEQDPMRGDLETIHRAGVAAKDCLSTGGRAA